MKDTDLSSKNGSLKLETMEYSSNDPFQQIMERAGNHGRYQLMFNTVFVMCLSITGAMIYMNIILALSVPDHWCTVAGREQTNFTLNEWRNLTLPTSKDNRGVEKYSSCQMYDVNFTDIHNWENWSSTSANITDCKDAWSYDQTWFKSTIATTENWVCSKYLYVTNVFIIGRAAEVVGSFLLGQMGDIFGRRLVYYISVVFSASGRLASTLTTSYYTWFLIFSCMTSLCINSLFQASYIIAMEISRESDRSTIAMYYNFGWSVGITLVPLIFWWVREWEMFLWISTVPTALYLIISSYVIESPRWLISKKRFGDAIVQFKKIAKVNGRQFDVTDKELAQMFSQTKQEVTYGMASLFSGWRLARNTSILGFCRCVTGISYFTMVLLSSVMSGNPFLNFLLQSVAEIPAYFLGKYLGDKFGRRCSSSFALFSGFLTCLLIIYFSAEKKYEFIVIGLASFIKFLSTFTFFLATLHGMEIYPTCMRQTGMAFGSILANSAGCFAPLLVYLSSTVDIRSPYYILCVFFLISSTMALFLPETLHKKLPDTMEEARQFGVNGKFFSLPKVPSTIRHVADNDAMEKLNQTQYSP